MDISLRTSIFAETYDSVVMLSIISLGILYLPWLESPANILCELHRRSGSWKADSIRKEGFLSPSWLEATPGSLVRRRLTRLVPKRSARDLGDGQTRVCGAELVKT